MKDRKRNVLSRRFTGVLAVLMAAALLGGSLPFVSLAAGDGEDTEGIPLRDKYSGFEGQDIDWEYGSSSDIPGYKQYSNEYESVLPGTYEQEIPLDSLRAVSYTHLHRLQPSRIVLYAF